MGEQDPGSGLRLPATADRLSALQEQLEQFERLPHSKGRVRFQHRDGNFTATPASPVVAERLSLPDSVQDFDPRPFLSPLLGKSILMRSLRMLRICRRLSKFGALLPELSC